MSDPAAFIPHILKPNREALEALITKPEVERKLLLRLQKKATTYAQDFGPEGEPTTNGNGTAKGGGKLSASAKIDVDGVVDLYESYIIPLTKEVEVRFLHGTIGRMCFNNILAGGLSPSSTGWLEPRRNR